MMLREEIGGEYCQEVVRKCIQYSQSRFTAWRGAVKIKVSSVNFFELSENECSVNQ